MHRCHLILKCVGHGRCGMWPETGAELNREVGISAPLKPRDPRLTGKAFVYGVLTELEGHVLPASAAN